MQKPKRQLLRIVIVLLSLFTFSHASFDETMATIAAEISESLELSPDKPLHITTINEDKQYMLSMEPVFKELKGYLTQYASEVRFKSSDEGKVIYEMIRRGLPMKLNEITVDSLILTGGYFLMNKSLEKVNCILKIQDIRAVNLYECDEFTISQQDCPPALERILFNKLVDNKAYAEIKYKGYVIEKLDKLFNTGNNNLLLPPAVYCLENRHPYAIRYQLNAFKEILNLKYGIGFNQNAENKIRVIADGTVTFSRNSVEWPLQRIIDGEPLYGNDFSEPCTSYTIIRKPAEASKGSIHLEERKFSTDSEMKVREKIYKTFNKYYPALFDPFQYEKLDKIFAERKEPSILVGNVQVSNPVTGFEQVAYSWHTKRQWLDHLKDLNENHHRRFEVNTSMMKIFNDDVDPNRYWAIVRQKWKTIDSFGKTIYTDNGFLFVNFDFTADRVLKDFKIHYRLWFYEYRYDYIEKGIKRHEKLQEDITMHFKEKIKAIPEVLKEAMSDYLISQIRREPMGPVAH